MENQKIKGGQSLNSIFFNYNTSEVVVSLSHSKDSLLVMSPTAARSAKCETATDEDEGVDDIKENVATNSAEISTQQLSGRAAEKCLHAHQGPAAGGQAEDVHVDLIL